MDSQILAASSIRSSLDPGENVFSLVKFSPPADRPNEEEYIGF
jgi:hypothetical protein